MDNGKDIRPEGMNNDLIRVIEALIFSSDMPLREDRIREILDDPSINVSDIVDRLNKEYEEQHRSFFITYVAEGYQMVTRPEYAIWIKKLYAKGGRLKLSKAGLETIAIIAYKQPITKAEIESIRGVNSDGVIKTLLERDLIKIEGRMDAPGRPLMYGTTDKFLIHFGLKSIDDLPRLKEIDEIMNAENAATK